LSDLNAVMGIVSGMSVPDEESKICSVKRNLDMSDKSFVPMSVRQMFRWYSGASHKYDINLMTLRGSSSFGTTIGAVEDTSHDGSAFYDPERNIIVAVSGNGNNCRDVMITHLSEGLHGETRRHENLIPFGSHGQYPIFDGVRFAYFCQSEDDDDNRFGRLDLDELTFEELAQFPGTFKEFCSGCCVLGKIYVVGDDDGLYEYNPAENVWTRTPLNIASECRLLSDPLGEGHMYVLEDDEHGFYSVDVEDFTKTLITNPEHSFDLNQNGEALVVALPDQSRILFTSLSDTWYCYLFETDEWIRLAGWEDVRNGSAHLVIVPDGPTALYHIDDHPNWTGVRLA